MKFLLVPVALALMALSSPFLNAQSLSPLAELEKQKTKAVADQNYTLAADLSNQIKALKEKEIRKAAKIKELETLEKEKKEAIAKQDYALAGEIKKKMAKLTEMDELEKQKKLAIEKQDYALAGELKKKITKLGEIEELEWQKKEAVAKQDYQKAGELNKKIIALRGGSTSTPSSSNSSGNTAALTSAPGAASADPYLKTERSKIRHSEDNGDKGLQYRRSSLYTMMLQDASRVHADVIARSFVDFPLPVKFNDHDLNRKVIPATGADPLSNIQQYLNTNAIAKEMVAKWFNRSDNGTFSMDLVGERGNYNATVADLKTAALSARGNALLADAGEDLIGNTFVVINDFKYTNKEDVANTAKLGLGLANIGSAMLGGPDLTNVTTVASAGLTVAGKGYIIKNTSYLFRLVWNEEVAARFYQDYWMDDASFDASKKLAFENSSIFTLRYIGQESAWADLQSTSFTAKSEEELIAGATLKAINSGIAKLQRKFEEFRTKTPLYSTSPLAARIGTKEGVEAGQSFEVLEAVQDPTGKITYVRKGVIKASTVWDNSFEVAGQDPSLVNGYTIFKGPALFYPGMLIRQIN